MTQTFHETKLALGSDTTLVVVGDMTVHAAELLLSKLWRQVYIFERSFSRFIPASELTLFNRSAGMKVPVTPEFHELLFTAKQLGLESDGLFNPLILPALQRAGYKQSFVEAYTEDVPDDYSDRTVADVSQLELGDTWARIPYGSAFDAGGFGKGYLADQLADSVESYGLNGFWFSLGGDMAGAGVDEHGNPWQVHVSDASHDGTTLTNVLGTTNGKRFAAATSGTTIRRGVGWHHIIDPRTLRPAETNILMATVMTDTAVRADVLASSALIVGSQEAGQFLGNHGVHNAVIQIEGPTKEISVVSFGEQFSAVAAVKARV